MSEDVDSEVYPSEDGKFNFKFFKKSCRRNACYLNEKQNLQFACYRLNLHIFFWPQFVDFFLVRSMTFLLQTRFSVRKTSAFRFSEVSCPKRKWFTGDVATSSLTPSFHSFSHFITATVHWIFKNIFWKYFLDLHNPGTLIGGFDLKRFFKKI